MGIKTSSKPNMKWANSQKPMVSRSRLDWILTLLQPCVLLLVSSTPLKRDAKIKNKKNSLFTKFVFRNYHRQNVPFSTCFQGKPTRWYHQIGQTFLQKIEPNRMFWPSKRHLQERNNFLLRGLKSHTTWVPLHLDRLNR